MVRLSNHLAGTPSADRPGLHVLGSTVDFYPRYNSGSIG